MTVPGTPPASLAAAIANVHVQVTPENVLEVRNALLSEAENLMMFAATDLAMSKPVGHCGGDPISLQASEAFSQRIGALTQHCIDYAVELKKAGESLDGIARRYGYTESEIHASFTYGADEARQ
jgi:hypothetical protein